MRSDPKHDCIGIIAGIALALFCIPQLYAQKVLGYGPDERTADVHYSQFLYGIYRSIYDTLPEYPKKGAYSPTGFSLAGQNVKYSTTQGTPIGNGMCNYIYVPTGGLLQPGHQYRIRLTVEVAEAYHEMQYYRDHFGVALASDLAFNHSGLLNKHFVRLDISTPGEPVTVECVFRPLCASQYLLLGVFQGESMFHTSYFAVQYGFALHNLEVEVWEDPNADFVYLCDAFEEERLRKKFTPAIETDTVYFDSGLAVVRDECLSVLDSVPSKLNTTQDLIRLAAYTDKAGEDNEQLGAARNASVREALVARGVDSARIVLINYGESKASKHISQQDRRVEITVNQGKLFQKYYTEALQASAAGDYGVANAKISRWLRLVPPECAIYALFDCWGQDEKAMLFRRDLTRKIRSRYYYKANDLKFTLDSLYCEDQKGRTLPLHMALNYLPGTFRRCFHDVDAMSDVKRQEVIERFYSEHGFPAVKEVGMRGNQALPYMILHTRDTAFIMKYLPIVQKACEEEQISWEYYAMLSDKIGIARNGRQRYGTQWMTDENGQLLGLYPFEDESMAAEYRKRVGLAPLSDF